MISVVTKSGNLASFLKGTSQVVSNGLKPFVPVTVQSDKIVVPIPQIDSVSLSLQNALPKSGNIRVRSGPVVTTQVRLAHTDIRVPDFSAYRRDSTKDPTKKSIAEDRKNFTYVIVGAASVGSAYAAKTIVTEFVSSMSASADVLAMAKIEIKLADIPEGKNVTFKWRGKPLFIRHRSGDEISTEQKVDVSTLRDPESDADRAQRPEWLVVIGVCTHLGCVPIANAGDWGGYYCPCHGSHYDASGRIRKGPAPLNLEVPPYTFPDETTLLVG